VWPRRDPTWLAELLRVRLQRLPEAAQQCCRRCRLGSGDVLWYIAPRQRAGEEETLDAVETLLDAVYSRSKGSYEFVHRWWPLWCVKILAPPAADSSISGRHRRWRSHTPAN